jgi:hypothetical protein
VRKARLLLDCPLPEARPTPPPTILPTLRPEVSFTVVGVTAVMRPYCTRVCASATAGQAKFQGHRRTGRTLFLRPCQQFLAYAYADAD